MGRRFASVRGIDAFGKVKLFSLSLSVDRIQKELNVRTRMLRPWRM
jgi:hypothetical protein